MKQLKESRLTSKRPSGTGRSTALAQAGRDSMITQTNVRSQASSSVAFADGSPVDILLFGFKRSQSAFATSFNASQGSDTSSGNVHVVAALRNLIKVQPLIQYHISTVGSDGRRIYSEENTAAAGGIAKLSHEAQL